MHFSRLEPYQERSRMKFNVRTVANPFSLDKKPDAIVHELDCCDFKIIASSAGVKFSGTSRALTTQKDLQALAEEVGKAWEDFSKVFKKKIHVNPGGLKG